MSQEVVGANLEEQALTPLGPNIRKLIEVLSYDPKTMTAPQADAQIAVEEVLEQYDGIPVDLGVVCDVTGSMRDDWENLCSILKKLFFAAADFQPVKNNPLSRLSLRVRFVLFRDLEHNFTRGKASSPKDWERIQVTDWISNHNKLEQVLDWVEVDGGGEGDGETSLEALSVFLAIAGIQAGWTKSLEIMQQVIEFIKVTQRAEDDQRPAKPDLEVIKPKTGQIREMLGSRRQGVGTSVIFLTDEPPKTSREKRQGISQAHGWRGGPWKRQHTVQKVAQAYQQAGIPVFAITTERSAYGNEVKASFEPIWQGGGWWNLGDAEKFDAEGFLRLLLEGARKTSCAGKEEGGMGQAVGKALTAAVEETANRILAVLPPGDPGQTKDVIQL